MRRLTVHLGTTFSQRTFVVFFHDAFTRSCTIWSFGRVQKKLNNNQKKLNNNQKKLNNNQKKLNNNQKKLNNNQKKLNNNQKNSTTTRKNSTTTRKNSTTTRKTQQQQEKTQQPKKKLNNPPQKKTQQPPQKKTQQHKKKLNNTKKKTKKTTKKTTKKKQPKKKNSTKKTQPTKKKKQPKTLNQPKKNEILPSKIAENEIARVWLNERMEFSWVSELLVLGCHLDGSGSTETLVQRRLEQGRKMFGKTRSLLSCHKIPEEERLRTFYSTVVPCVLWGSGCWVPSAKIQQLLSFQEDRWLRCMLGGRKTQDVARVDWFRTTKRVTHALRTKMNLPSLWHRALAAMYGWAGHVARKDDSHPGRAAILWRNARWWEIMKSIGAGSRHHSWRHRKRNWVRSFEHGLSKILGVDWWEVAKRDRSSWKEGKF